MYMKSLVFGNDFMLQLETVSGSSYCRRLCRAARFSHTHAVDPMGP